MLLSANNSNSTFGSGCTSWTCAHNTWVTGYSDSRSNFKLVMLIVSIFWCYVMNWMKLCSFSVLWKCYAYIISQWMITLNCLTSYAIIGGLINFFCHIILLVSRTLTSYVLAFIPLPCVLGHIFVWKAVLSPSYFTKNNSMAKIVCIFSNFNP